MESIKITWVGLTIVPDANFRGYNQEFQLGTAALSTIVGLATSTTAASDLED